MEGDVTINGLRSTLDSQSQLDSMVVAAGATADNIVEVHVDEKQRIRRGIAAVAGLNFIEASTSYTSSSIFAKNVQS